jgi:uncharacterized protein YecE (DUF72 family)
LVGRIEVKNDDNKERYDNVYIGTSGYSYEDWVGPFYPDGTDKSDMLAYYARYFRAVEINFTYYRMPNARTMAAIAAKAAGRVLFAVKLVGELTHEREDGDPKLIRNYLEALRPMTDQNVLGVILAQFPWSFKRTGDALAYLQWLSEKLSGHPLAVEFRNREWDDPAVLETLREAGVAYVNVDEPKLKGLIRPSDYATSDKVGYFRFHGRNAAKWWKHERAEERYDYLYTKDELTEWIPRIKKVAGETGKTYVFMNNHPLGKAVENARQLMEMLGQEFLLDLDESKLF